MKNLHPLANLEEARSIALSNNDGLNDIRGLSGVAHLDVNDQGWYGFLSIRKNPDLASLEGLHKIVRARGVEVYGNHQLVDLHGLRSLGQVTENLDVGVVLDVF